MRLLLVAAPLADSGLAEALFPGVPPTVVDGATLRVTRPWRGELFDLVGAAAAPGGDATSAEGEPAASGGEPADDDPARGPTPPAPAGGAATIGLLVPVVWVAAEPAPELAIVADHVNTRLAGPLTGRRPVSGPARRGPQPFPSLAGLYQPETIRRAVGRRVYSVVAVAGVARVGELSPFERRAIAAAGCPAACDCLVDAAVVAALHGFRVAACGVPL